MTERIRPAILSKQPPLASIMTMNLVDDMLEQESSTPTTEANKPSFALFNDLSQQLSESYSVLEKQVAQLTTELNTVSEQRIQELGVREQVANRLEQLMNLLPGGVVVLDHHGVIIEINPAAESMLEPNLTGQRWREVIKQCFSPKSDDGHEVSNHRGQRINIATRSLGLDGQIILLTDQTQTRKLQAELSRHERLSALGKMVSTLAHQVRTPLSSAMLYGSHLLNSPLSPQQQEKFTQKLVNRLHEMERQVRDMLIFVKADIALDDHLSLAELQKSLSEAMEMPLAEQNIICQWDNEYPDDEICCHKDALTGAVLNLVNNSLQAMPEEGRLLIRFKVGDLTPNQADEPQQACDSHTPVRTYLHIDVSDNGVGISKEHSEQVHELFYTTKAHGTGIGLTVVETVAKSHGGSFRLQANDPCGVSAQLSLPIVCRSSN